MSVERTSPTRHFSTASPTRVRRSFGETPLIFAQKPRYSSTVMSGYSGGVSGR